MLGTDLSRRATGPELLDEGVPEEEARRSLGDLRLVNRWLGGRRSLGDAVRPCLREGGRLLDVGCGSADLPALDRKSTRLNSSHSSISYAVFCLKKKTKHPIRSWTETEIQRPARS